MYCIGNHPYQIPNAFFGEGEKIKKNGIDIQHISTLSLSLSVNIYLTKVFPVSFSTGRIWIDFGVSPVENMHKHPRCHSISWSSFMDILEESVHVNSVTVALSHV